jgi:hypothetical protein
MRFNMNDTQQQALGFLIAQTTYIEPQVYRIKYPDLLYSLLVPIDTSAPEWAKSITFFSVDQVGAAQWFNANANDIPLADIAREKFENGIEMAGIGYRYNLEELGQAMMVPNTNLSIERAAAARRGYETFVNNATLYGDTAKTWQGLMNSPVVPVINVSGGDWTTKALTADGRGNILSDFNLGLVNMWQSSLTVEMADTVLLPLSTIGLMAMTQVPQTNMNLLEWVAKNNLYTQQTGQPLLIRAMRGLDTAGVGGVRRMIAYRRSPEVVKCHIPMPHRFLPVWQRGPIVFDVPGIFRLGGLEVRLPGAMRYIDGI